MQEILKEEDKEFVYDILVRLLNQGSILITGRASRKAFDSDFSWTPKALIEGMLLHAILKNPLYIDESSSEHHEGEIVYLIKPFINDLFRWIIFTFGLDEEGNEKIVVIISAHKDEKIYGKEGGQNE